MRMRNGTIAADQRVALALGHRERPRRVARALEALHQRVEDRARLDRILDDREHAVRVDGGVVPRRHRLGRLGVPRRRHVRVRAVEDRDRSTASPPRARAGWRARNGRAACRAARSPARAAAAGARRTARARPASRASRTDGRASGATTAARSSRGEGGGRVEAHRAWLRAGRWRATRCVSAACAAARRTARAPRPARNGTGVRNIRTSPRPGPRAASAASTSARPAMRSAFSARSREQRHAKRAGRLRNTRTSCVGNRRRSTSGASPWPSASAAPAAARRSATAVHVSSSAALEPGSRCTSRPCARAVVASAAAAGSRAARTSRGSARSTRRSTCPRSATMPW